MPSAMRSDACSAAVYSAVPCRAAVLLWPRVARQPVVVVHRKLCYDVRCCNCSGTVQTARACTLYLACLRAVCCMLRVVRREERKGTKRAREKLRADPVASKKPSVPEGPGTLLVGYS